MLQDSHLQRRIPQNFLKAFTVFKIKFDKVDSPNWHAKLQSTLRPDSNLNKVIALAWNTKRFAIACSSSSCVYVKHITLCNCLCSSSSRFSASRIRNIGASHTRDFRSCHSVKSHVTTRLIRPSENGFGHLKKKLKRQARVVLRKKLFVILC